MGGGEPGGRGDDQDHRDCSPKRPGEEQATLEAQPSTRGVWLTRQGQRVGGPVETLEEEEGESRTRQPTEHDPEGHSQRPREAVAK